MISVIEHFNLGGGGGENQHFHGCTKYLRELLKVSLSQIPQVQSEL